MTASYLPHFHLLCIADEFSVAFNEALIAHGVSSAIIVNIHDYALSTLPSSVRFDLVVSPANSYGLLDGGFDDAISRAFSPREDYFALTRLTQSKLYEEYRGFAPPGTCTLIPIPDDFHKRSKNVWGTKHLALCPTMRLPQDVRWDKEVVYEAVWTLLCAVDKHNRGARDDEKIRSLLMSPLATGTGFVSAQKWANQAVLAIKHFIEAVEKPAKWSALGWPDIRGTTKEVEQTWAL